MDKDAEKTVKIRANSPGRYSILVVELPTGELLTTYSETGYSLEQSKPVKEDWLNDNAIGRHSFVAVDPPEEVPASSLAEYARRKSSS